MKILKKILVAAACSLAFGAAQADVITVDLSQNPTPGQQLVAPGVAKLTFDFNSLLASYFVTAADITSAFLEVNLNDPNKGDETYSVGLDGVQFVTGSGNKNHISNGKNFVEYRNIPFAAALAALQADGITNVTIAATAGEFYFMDAKLSVSFEQPVPPASSDVPEPASLALLGLGLAGVAAMRRKKI